MQMPISMLIPTEVFDENKNFLRIDFYDLDAKFIFTIECNEVYKQSEANHQIFREESYEIAESKGDEVVR